MRTIESRKRAVCCWVVAGLCLTAQVSLSQDRLKTMPGYERFQRITRASTNVFKSGALSVTWTNGGAAFDYQKDGKRFRYDLTERAATELPPPPTNTPASRPNRHIRIEPNGSRR